MADDVTLREYLEVRIDAERDARIAANEAQAAGVQLALSAADRAVVKAEAAAEKRFDSVNEFRKTLADQAQGFVSKSEVEQRFIALADRLSKLEDVQTRHEGTGAGSKATLAWVVTAITVALGVAGVLIAVLSKS